MPKLKLFVIVCLVLLSVVVMACNSREATLVPATLTVTPPTQPPTVTPVPGYIVSGTALDSSNNYLLGGLVTLEPTGMSSITSTDDGLYVIYDVPDGQYEVSVAPECVAYGCFIPKLLFVSGSDILDFHLAPVPASTLPSGPAAARSVIEGLIELEKVEFPGDNLILISPNDLQPGDTVQIVLAAPECIRCVELVAVDAPVVWSVEPRAGASINPDTGLLSVSSAAATDFAYTVTADVGDGQFSVSAEVNIYSAIENPLAGVWTESETGNINRLLLTADGEFAVTINPYGNYQDYWGNYTFDVDTSFIELTATGANQVTPEGQGTGTYSIDASGKLSLEGGICLGRWDSNTQSPAMNCGHEFLRQPFNR